MTDLDVLEVSVHIDARPETVFRYFTDPTRYAQWMGREATIEAVPGGTYRVRMGNGVEVSDSSSRSTSLDESSSPGARVDLAVPPGSTRVEVTLSGHADGTDLLLRHYGLPDAAQREHHLAGWQAYLHRLAVRATGGDPGPDPNAAT